MADHDDLLKRFAPVLRYDSNEQYFVDSAVQWTDCPNNELRRADVAEGKKGPVLAEAVPTGKQTKLTLAFLGREKYASGEPFTKGDIIGHSGRDYREAYVRLRKERPELRNVMYGRAVEQNGRLWLQYWFWYFYNDYQLAFDAGLHEGDWEMVQLRMHPTEERPDLAVYAQHRYGEKRSWGGVRKDGERPIVYVARGSHAAYFEPGFHQTEAWYDLADGKRPAPDLTLELIRPDTHAWMLWKGRWGDTKPNPRDKVGLHSNSPTGPGRKKQWDKPSDWHNEATETKLGEAQERPEVKAVRDRGRLRIDYDFRERDPRPSALVVTVNSRDETGVPPQTHTFEDFDATGKGHLATGVALDPAKHYDVYTSTVAGDPPMPSESRLSEIDPVGGKRQDSLVTRLTIFLSRLIARVRGDR